MSHGLFYRCPCYASGRWSCKDPCCLWRVRELSDSIKNILICVPKMNGGLTGLDFWVNYPFNIPLVIKLFRWILRLFRSGRICDLCQFVCWLQCLQYAVFSPTGNPGCRKTKKKKHICKHIMVFLCFSTVKKLHTEPFIFFFFLVLINIKLCRVLWVLFYGC